MSDEEILNMDRNRTVKVKAKPIDITELMKRVEALENQEHTCDCPNRIIDMNKEMQRLDYLDENDELLRQNINRSHKDLQDRLDEEHRLRVRAENQLNELSDEIFDLKERKQKDDEALIDQALHISKMEDENKRFASQNLKLGVLAGVCMGLCLCVLACFMAGLV